MTSEDRLSKVKLPPIKWAQRKDSVYITIDIPDAEVKKLNLQGKSLDFHAVSKGTEYKCKLEFYKELDPNDENSKYDVKPREIHFHIMKKEKEDEYWPRLLEDKKLEKTHISIDWSRFVDEDEEEGGFDLGDMSGGGMNFADMMGGGGGGGGAGGMDMNALQQMMGQGGGGGEGGGMDMNALQQMMGQGGGGGEGGGMDMNALQQMMAQQGAGGEGGGEGGDDDSDDEELPDLEGEGQNKGQ